MNERIRELAEQAGLVFWEISGDVDWRQANREHLEEFAQLIVRECASVVNNIPPCFGDYRDQIEENMRNYCARVILEHFGVE